MRTTLDTTCRVGFGVDLGCLSPGLPKLPFSVSFENSNAPPFTALLIRYGEWSGSCKSAGRKSSRSLSRWWMSSLITSSKPGRPRRLPPHTWLATKRYIYSLHHTIKYVYGGLLLGYCYLSHNCGPASDISNFFYVAQHLAKYAMNHYIR